MCYRMNYNESDMFWLGMLLGLANWDSVGEKSKTSPHPVGESTPLKILIDRVADTNSPDLQLTLIEEEYTEVLKEICKLRRGKGVRENLSGELIDVLTASIVFLKQLGYTKEAIEEEIKHNLIYAINQDNSLGKR